MRVVFFDKKKETYEVVENATHMHVDIYLEGKRNKVFVVYTESAEVKFFPSKHYDLHKIDC